MGATSQQEVYIALVVVKQPAGMRRPELDPERWAQSVLNGLPAQGANHMETARYRPGGPVNGRSKITRGFYVWLGLICLCLAAWAFYLGSQ